MASKKTKGRSHTPAAIDTQKWLDSRHRSAYQDNRHPKAKAKRRAQKVGRKATR